MNNPQIMIVEDELLIAQEIQDVLEDHGYEVVHTERSGIEAVSQAEKLKPDLILMDIVLEGGTSGITAAYKINEKENIPIVYLTGNSDKKTREEAAMTNPMGYLIKPFDKKKLYQTIDNALFRCKDNPEVSLIDDSHKDVRKDLSTNVYQNNYSQNQTLDYKPVEKSKSNLKIERLLERQKIKLYRSIKKLESNVLSQLEMNKLIEFSCQLAQHRALKRISRLYVANRKWELSIEDIAIEAIASLFVTNKKRDMLNITCTLNHWEHPIENDIDAFFFLIKTVHISVDQFINKLLKETDPNFSKILDSVNYSIRKNSFKKVSYIGTIYLVKNNFDQPFENVITPEEFSNLHLDGDGTEDIIMKTFAYLEEDTNYSAIIPVNGLVRMIQSMYENDYNYTGIQHCDHATDLHIDDMVKSTLKEIFNKLDSSYLHTNKLNVEETRAMKKTLHDIMVDLRQGQLNWGLNEYLKVYIPDMTKDKYKKHYQNILDYLFKSLKRILKEKLLKEN